MTTAAARADRTLTVMGVAAAGAAIAVGVALTIDLRLGAALALGAVLAPLAVLDLPVVIALWAALTVFSRAPGFGLATSAVRSEEHTSELQSHSDLVCRLLLEKK